MITLKHVHVFLKAGVTIEHNDTAETLLFNMLDFIIALATFDRWASRYVRLRYFILSRYWGLIDYLNGWYGDLMVMRQALQYGPVWGTG